MLKNETNIGFNNLMEKITIGYTFKDVKKVIITAPSRKLKHVIRCKYISETNKYKFDVVDMANKVVPVRAMLYSCRRLSYEKAFDMLVIKCEEIDYE